MTIKKSICELEADIQESWNENLIELTEIKKPNFAQIKEDVLSENVEIEYPAGELGADGKITFKEECESATEKYTNDIKNGNILFKNNIIEFISNLVFSYEYEKDE